MLHDYKRRLEWDTLLSEAYLEPELKMCRENYLQKMLFVGAKRVSTELVFADGKTVIAPLSVNQAEVLKLLETIPAQRQGEEHL